MNDFVEFASPFNGEQDYENHTYSMKSERGFIGEHSNDTFALSARCLLISFGNKPGA